MPAKNRMIATGIPNVRQRAFSDGDIGYYIKKDNSFLLVGRQSEGMSPELIEKRFVVNEESFVTLDMVFKKFKAISGEDLSKTRRDYMTRYELHLKNRFGSKRLEDITSTSVGNFYHEMFKKHSESHAYQCCHLIRFLYKRAIEWGMYSGKVPMGRDTDFVLPMPQRKREEIFTEDDMILILGALKPRSKQVHDMVRLSYVTGLRLDDVFGLCVCNINFKTGVIKVVDTKTKIDIHVCVEGEILHDLKERTIGKPANDFVFKSRLGTRIKCLSKTFNRVLEELGINEGIEDSRFIRTFHSLRHTFATVLIQNGVPISDVQALLGHKSIKTTERYIKPAENRMFVAANIMTSKLASNNAE